VVEQREHPRTNSKAVKRLLPALAAIQGLHEILKEKDAEIADLKARFAALEATVATLASQQPGSGQ